MNKLDKVATDFYEVAKDYKEYFYKSKTNLKEKNNIEKYLIGFYNSHQLYNFVKKDKDNSIKEIKKFINDNYGIMTLYNIIESNITSTEDLDNINYYLNFI